MTKQEFTTVSKDEFYAYIRPRDIIVSSYANETLFTTRDGRTVVGKTEGYKSDEKTYQLKKGA